MSANAHLVKKVSTYTNKCLYMETWRNTGSVTEYAFENFGMSLIFNS